MKIRVFVTLFLLTGFAGLGQINMEASTARVKAQWEEGEKRSYAVTAELVNMEGSKVSKKEIVTYDVDVTVLSVTNNSYIIEWLYMDITTNSPHPIEQKLAKTVNGMKVVFTTDEFGVFDEILNWQDMRGHIQNAVSTLRGELVDVPNIDQVFQQYMATFLTKESIEATSIKDIKQYHGFHGGNYKLGEKYEFESKIYNPYGPEPFDADLTVWLSEINETENNLSIHSAQEVNAVQMVDAIFKQMLTISESVKSEPPRREDFNDMRNVSVAESKILGSGWVVYSSKTTTISIANTTRIEKRVIELE